MPFSVRDGRFDVAVVAGPRTLDWPTIGVPTLASVCAKVGLKVGVFSGPGLWARGVVPLPGTGGLVFVEDAQRRFHRIRARAVVRFSSELDLPEPFEGWRSPGLVPLPTARALLASGKVSWEPAVAILGTGNRALRFGSLLLERELCRKVACIETGAQWGGKRYAAWEVERRRFETAGGRLVEAAPVSLVRKSALIWELRIRDAYGVQILHVSRLVSAGPFANLPGIREFPPSSGLYEIEQTALPEREEDVEGWELERARSEWLGSKLARGFARSLGDRKEELDSIHRRARTKLKRLERHRERPFAPGYDGKWLDAKTAGEILAFKGVPREAQVKRPIASIECIEDIACNVCEKVCPETAIRISRGPEGAETFLDESKCTGCGVCVSACPSSAIAMVDEKQGRSLGALTLPWRGPYQWKPGELATLVNRKGESLGSARVASGVEAGLVRVDVPSHLLPQARGIRRAGVEPVSGAEFLEGSDVVDVTLNGARRRVREKVPLSLVLIETGLGRSEDGLLCPDGSCRLCMIEVDGSRQLACQTRVRRGMSIRTLSEATAPLPDQDLLCPCMGVTRERVLERLRHGKLSSADAVVSATHVGEGRCHGQLCRGPFRRALIAHGLDAHQWVDWRFPWSEWTLTSGPG